MQISLQYWLVSEQDACRDNLHSAWAVPAFCAHLCHRLPADFPFSASFVYKVLKAKTFFLGFVANQEW